MLCSNPKCVKEFTPTKAWGRYCSRACGDRVRRLRYYHSTLKPRKLAEKSKS